MRQDSGVTTMELNLFPLLTTSNKLVVMFTHKLLIKNLFYADNTLLNLENVLSLARKFKLNLFLLLTTTNKLVVMFTHKLLIKNIIWADSTLTIKLRKCIEFDTEILEIYFEKFILYIFIMLSSAVI